ncbi:lytic polysaccharide monooxygenase [Lentithecium fluviatile CBS 122367]|uniref:lytic cellulose monooxygenase (C4-dehydrogenating) n=1 Tax=Lentithecium fluviatile CBS 122367 TaxID=1168545 RepID=A0A6G1IME6_9PLEO|nr:lytic polysaccharide monooxygenase [Lentithecium fluviatile CBS 122367]
MKCSGLALSTALLSQGTKAHYIFSRLTVNNTLSTDFQYVRDVATNPDGHPEMFGKGFPLVDGLFDLSHVCGRSAFPVRNSSIQTAIIIAGDEVGFHLSGPYSEGDTYQPVIFHMGPGQVFLSKLPEGLTDLSEYDGKGDFFKIAYAGVKDNKFVLLNEQAMNFAIPVTTPPGKYLMRLEHWMADYRKGNSQWYVSCAHVEIKGSGGGKPSEFIKFPGAYSEEDPSIWFRDPNTGDFPKDSDGNIDLSNYVGPKPDVWAG